MSLPLVPAILSAIALAIDSTEASPARYEDIEKRSIDFTNSASSTKKSSSTKKATSTTKKAATTTKKKTSTTKAASVSNAISNSVASSLPTPSTINPILLPSSSAILIASTSGISSSITGLASSSPTQSASKSSGGLSGGAIGAIVAVIIIIIGGIAAYLCISKRKKNKARTRAITKPDPFTMGFGSDGGFQAFNSQPPMQHNPQIQVSSYQQHNQPSVPVATPATPSSPYYPDSNTQFHDANNHIIASSMMPTIVPQYQAEAQPPRMPPTQAGSLGVFFVVATYTPTLSDEVDIQLGDQVELLVEYDDGWCQGINLTRGHAKGVFPKHCIENGNGGTNVDRIKRVSSMYMA